MTSLNWARRLLLLGLVLCHGSCGGDENSTSEHSVDVERVTLGRYLFYDTRLSINGKRSCGICHEQAKGFTDGFPRAVGATHELHPRNTGTLTNIGRREQLLWARSTPLSLGEQLLVPLLGEDPVEMGMGGQEALLFDRLGDDPHYPARFKRAFPEEEGTINLDTIARALVAFERTLVSEDAPYDRFQSGQPDAMSASAQRGMALFFSEAAKCYRCHSGPDFDSPADENGRVFSRHGAFNLGLYNLDEQGAYPDYDQGLFAETGVSEDMGRFRTPTLRNVTVTGPYTHDGTVASLEDMVRIYVDGGRNNRSGPYVGDGRLNPHKSELLSGLELSDQDVSDLVAFLGSLTDERFLTNPAFANPFVESDSANDGSVAP